MEYYQFNENNSLYFKSIYNHRDDWENRFRMRIRSIDMASNGTSGTATSSGFIIASAKRNSTGNVSNSIRLTITVGSTPFMVKDQTVYSGAQVSLTVPIAKGETYSVTVGSISTLESSKFKAFVS